MRMVITNAVFFLVVCSFAQKNDSRKIDKMNYGLVGVWQFQKVESSTRMSDRQAFPSKFFVEFFVDGSFRYFEKVDGIYVILDSGYWYPDYEKDELRMEILAGRDTILRTDYPFAFDDFYHEFVTDMKAPESSNSSERRGNWDMNACNNDTLVQLNMDVQVFKISTVNPKQLILDWIYNGPMIDMNPPKVVYYYRRVAN